MEFCVKENLKGQGWGEEKALGFILLGWNIFLFAWFENGCARPPNLGSPI
jgi:hypothetical protein